MSKRKALCTISGRTTAMQTSDILQNVGFSYNGTTKYDASEIVQYSNSSTTDSNGRIVFNATIDGTTNGTAIFSAIHNASIIAKRNNSAPEDSTFFYIDTISVNLKQITVRGTTGRGVLLGGVTMAFAGSGITAYILVTGLP